MQLIDPLSYFHRNKKHLLAFFRVVIFIACAIPSGRSHAAIVPLNFTLNMSEVVTVDTSGGTPTLTIDIGGVQRTSTFSSGSGTNALVFSYTPVAGDVDLDGITLVSPIALNGATIKDNAGNDIPIPAAFTVPTTTGIKINYPSLSMDFINDHYTLNGTAYNSLTTFLSNASGSFTRASIGRYYDSTGTLQTATANTPRFDHDPTTGTAKGLLLEEAKTNLLNRSEELDNTYWSKLNASVTANAIAAPDGSMTADYMKEANGSISPSSTISLNSPITVTSGAIYTASMYVKPNGRNYFTPHFNGVPSGGGAYFDLTGSGAVTNIGVANLARSITKVGSSGWYYITVTTTATSTSMHLGFNLSADGTTNIYTGNGTSGVYVWGVQLEQGKNPTSYIKTTSTAVTRSADILTIPTSSGWYSSTKGTFFGQYFLGNTESNARVVSLSSGAAPIVMNNSSLPAQWRNWSGASGPTATSPTIPTLTTAIKAAASWDNAGPTSTISAGGTTAVTGTYTAGAYNSTNIYIGQVSAGLYFLNAPIKALKFYPVRIDNTQLQLMTQ